MNLKQSKKQMEDKFDILDALRKRPKPEVPEGFFDQFADSLELEKSFAEQDLFSKKSKPTVPEGFFDQFSAQLMDKIAEQEEEQQPSKRIFTLKNISIAASIAACLMLGFFLFNTNENNEIQSIASTQLEENETELTESDEAYLAFLDEDEMIDFLIENDDIDLDESSDEKDLSDDFYYLVDGEIEDFYLEDL